MKKSNNSNIKTGISDGNSLNRRKFIKVSAFAASGAIIGASCLKLAGTGYESDWKPLSFNRILLHNFKLFDGINNKLQEGLVILRQDTVICQAKYKKQPIESGYLL